MRIQVEHEVPFIKGFEHTCTGEGGFWGVSVCKYYARRDRTHGRKAPVEHKVPKCTLFDEWLPGDYQKCDKCFSAATEAALKGGKQDGAD